MIGNFKDLSMTLIHFCGYKNSNEWDKWQKNHVKGKKAFNWLKMAL